MSQPATATAAAIAADARTRAQKRLTNQCQASPRPTGFPTAFSSSLLTPKSKNHRKVRRRCAWLPRMDR